MRPALLPLVALLGFATSAQALQVSLWPTPDGNHAAVVGNPSSLSITIDAEDRSLDSLNWDSFMLSFDGMPLGRDFLFALPPRWWVWQPEANKVTVNFPHMHWPAGTHYVEVSISDDWGRSASDWAGYTFNADKGYEVGFYTQPLEDWQLPFDDWKQELMKVDTMTGRRHTLVPIFQAWADEGGNYRPLETFLTPQVYEMGAVPLVTWAPYKGDAAGAVQPDFDNTSIINGHHDAYIRDFARQVKAHGKPMIIRIMHEFNGAYYPWGGPANNNDPSLFVMAFRRVVELFREQGANNAEFMWSPNYVADTRVTGAAANIHNYWPGNDYVDWIGVSGYNWSDDTRVQGQGWLSFSDIFAHPQFDSFLPTMAAHYPDKKVILAEMGCGNGSVGPQAKADWVRDAYASMHAYPNIGGVVWMNTAGLHDAAQVWADFRVFLLDGGQNDVERAPVDPVISNAYIEAVR